MRSNYIYRINFLSPPARLCCMPTVVVTILSRICAEHTNQRSARLAHPATLIRLQLERNVGRCGSGCVGFSPHSPIKAKGWTMERNESLHCTLTKYFIVCSVTLEKLKARLVTWGVLSEVIAPYDSPRREQSARII